MFQLKLPQNYLWRNPGFPSIVISYTESNSLFFSGQIGLIFICALEFKKNQYIKIFFLSIMTIILEALLLIILRGNYIIDIFTAFLFSHYSFMIGEDYSYILDKFIFDSV